LHGFECDPAQHRIDVHSTKQSPAAIEPNLSRYVFHPLQPKHQRSPT
jgi:hypothetical protein